MDMHVRDEKRLRNFSRKYGEASGMDLIDSGFENKTQQNTQQERT
jgi:hypothetical protein